MNEELLKTLLAQGPLVSALIIAIAWFNNTQKKTNDLLLTERAARLNSMDEHIKQLDERSQACEADRLRLYQMSVDQERRIAELAVKLAGLIEHPSHGVRSEEF